MCLKSDHVWILPSRGWVWCSLPQWSNQPDQYSVTINGKSSLSASTFSKSWCPWLMSWKLTVGSASVKHERSVYNRLWQPMTAEWQDLSRCTSLQEWDILDYFCFERLRQNYELQTLFLTAYGNSIRHLHHRTCR